MQDFAKEDQWRKGRETAYRTARDESCADLIDYATAVGAWK